MRKLFLLLLLSASSLTADEPRKGTICFALTDCAPVTGSAFEVKPADLDRRFVWMSNDASSVVLGRLAAKAVSVDLDSKDARNVTLSVRGDARRGWPLETRFVITESKDRLWRWSVPAKLIGRTMSIRVPTGSYSMVIGAEHHKADRRPLRVANDVALREITLAPIPVVTGRVVTMKKTGDDKEPKETPVAGAQLARSDGKILGSANEQGAFRVELTEPLTKEMVIMSSGLGNRVVPLNIIAADTDLGVITLSGGVKLTAHVDRADSVKAKTLHATLTEASKTQYENTSVATRELKAGDDVLVFSDLSEGEYYLTLNGDGALEHLTTVIPIKTEDVSSEIHLSPFQLQGSVRLGSEPVREGVVSVHDRHHTWSAEAPINTEGRFGGTMWQADDIGGWVRSGEINSLPAEPDPVLIGDPATWEIAFRRRLITGRIFDDETKEPIPSSGLDMQLETTSRSPSGQTGISRLYSPARVDDKGQYSIVATRDGVYDLSARAPDHVTARTSITLGDGDESKTADFPLSKGVEQPIDFVWPSGEPIANARAVEGVARDGHNALWYGSADANGRLTLRMRAGETRTLFVIPAQGSFAPVHVVQGDGQPIRIVVPEPVASLVINYHDTEKKPRPTATAIRWNGEWLPQSVVSQLNISRAGAGSIRFALLPAGSYEVWAVPGIEPPFGPPQSEPVRVGLTSGEQTIEVTVPNL